MKNSHIGILTLPFEANYGYILQAFALYKILKYSGANPIMLNRKWNKGKESLIHKIKRFVYYKYFCKDLITFYNKIPNSKELRSSSELFQECLDLNVNKVVIGSDQVWSVPNTRGVGLDFFGEFVRDTSKLKLFSYAASFGKDHLVATQEEKIKIKDLLTRFKEISVREQSGAEIIKDNFKLDSEVVLDPTLLLSKEEWEKYFEKIKTKGELVTYILDNSEKKKEAIETFAKKINLTVNNLFNRGKKPFYSVEYWLSKIHSADFVIVDSFHGMVFSILFKKQFIVIANKRRGNTRFISLLDKLGLEDRLVYDEDDINIKEFPMIDYSVVEPIFEKERRFSMNFLDKILN